MQRWRKFRKQFLENFFFLQEKRPKLCTSWFSIHWQWIFPVKAYIEITIEYPYRFYKSRWPSVIRMIFLNDFQSRIKAETIQRDRERKREEKRSFDIEDSWRHAKSGQKIIDSNDDAFEKLFGIVAYSYRFALRRNSSVQINLLKASTTLLLSASSYLRNLSEYRERAFSSLQQLRDSPPTLAP